MVLLIFKRPSAGGNRKNTKTCTSIFGPSGGKTDFRLNDHCVRDDVVCWTSEIKYHSRGIKRVL